MKDIVQEKPRSVKIISWFLIAVSVYLLLTGLNSFLYQFSNAYRSAYLNALGHGMSESDVPMIFSRLVSSFLSVFGLLYGIGLFFSAIKFLKLNEWARKSLEVLTWLYIVQSVVVGVLIVSKISDMLIDMLSRVMSEEGARTFTTAMMIFVYLIFAVFIGVAGFIIKKLRSAEVRNAMLPESKVEPTPPLST